MSDKEWVEYNPEDAVVVRETEKAFLMQMNGGEEIWFPKSQMEIGEDVVRFSEWILGEKGLLEKKSD